MIKRFSKFITKITTGSSLLAIIFGALTSCGQQNSGEQKITNTKVDDGYKPFFTVAQLSEKLETRFKQMPSDSFAKIFSDWNQNIQPNADEFIYQNDTIKAVFDVYKVFYRPHDLLKLGNWEWGNKLNANSKYVAVQNKIFYSVLGSDTIDGYSWSSLRKDSIVNFRPPIDLDENSVLYLTQEYETSLNKFLGTQSTEVGEPNIMSPSAATGESEKRYEFLKVFIPVLHGHWGGYWHLETHPDVGVIIFNKTLTKAQINYRVGYQGGEAILERINNQWTIKESKATWIE
jgi:hypothetical protein